jgi:cullin 1
MTIFQYIDAKDAFEKYYTRLLSKRLVHNNSASEDAETNMVAKLKSACGYEYVHKLQRMFQDIALSQEMQQEFKSLLTKDTKDGIDFQVLVLATNFWPLPKPQTAFNLPHDLHPVFERFKGFYGKKHGGRKLQWLWNFSKAEVKAKFATGSKVAYTFHVSAYQLALLLPYNRADEYTIEQLEELSGLSKEILNGSLSILVRAHVLTQKPDNATLGVPGTSYALNFDFKMKKVRVNLNLPLKLEQKQESEETQKHIEEDRKHFLMAIIVRVMKARKELKHVQLVQETIEQSKKRFKPEISEIKRCIDALIEREYLRRVDGSKYQYVA